MSAKSVRVLHLGKYYPPDRGGIETYLEALSRDHLSDLDLRVIVSNKGLRTVREVVEGVPVVRMRTWLKLAGAPLNPGFIREIRRAKPDIVHLHVPNPSATMAVLASGYRGPIVVTYHSDVIRQRILGRVFEPIMQRLLARAGAIIVTSPNYLDSSPSLRPHRDRCRIIPLAINPAHLGQPDASIVEDLKRKYPGRMVLSVGRLTQYKGFDYLIRAARHFAGHLVIIGDGGERPHLEKLVQTLGLADRVHLVGNVGSTSDYYAAADLFVLPSIARSEAFGVVQLEAMAFGLPVINTNLASGVPFVSVHEKTGITVPAKDELELAAAIRHLSENPMLARAYGEAARRRVADIFDLREMAQSTMEVYEALLGRSITVRSSGKTAQNTLWAAS